MAAIKSRSRSQRTSATQAGGEVARLSCRISAPVKERAETAAALLGQSITGFTEAALAEKAQAVLESQERIALSERDFARFVALIESPPPPSPQLAAAMDEYRRLRAAHPASGL